MRQSYPQRKALRLQHYDYAQNGSYFVTLCTHNRECLFGEVINDKMSLNDAGRMVERWFVEVEHKFPRVYVDGMIIMPNHIHVVLFFVGDDLRVVPPQDLKTGGHIGPPLQQVMQWFKTMTTNAYIQGVKNNQWLPFHGKLWQRGYYDRIIRNEETLIEIQQYIFNNPAQWAFDENNIS